MPYNPNFAQKIKYVCHLYQHNTFSHMIQVHLGGHPPFPLNQHFEPMVLINHDIHHFDGEWNVISSSSCNDFLVVLCRFLQHSVNSPDPIRTP
jgi:hypothetical protein